MNMMKQILVLILTTFLASFSIAQNKGSVTWAKANNPELCFGSRYFMLSDEFKNFPFVESIIKQVGQHEFEKILEFTGDPNFPKGKWQFFDPERLSKKDLKTYNKGLSELNMYKIAQFENDRGQNAILRVPYLENKNWDSVGKWDTIYLIVEDKYVTESRMCSISNWENSSNVLPSNYWDVHANSIIDQVGTPEFSTIKRLTSQKNVPKNLALNNTDKNRNVSLLNKLAQLKGFKIASFEDKQKGRYAIFRSSYFDNKDWDKSRKWEVMYFVLPDSDTNVFKPVNNIETARN